MIPYLKKILVTGISQLLILSALYAQEAEVVIVQSSQAKPYQDAAEALEQELGGLLYNNSIRLLDLSEIKPDLIELLQNRTVFVAIGTKAAVYLGKALPPEAKFTYCMIANMEELKASGAIRGAGISTDIPMEVQFKLINETMPNIRSVGTLYRADDPKGNRSIVAIKNVLPYGCDLVTEDITQHNSISDAIKALCRKEVDLIWTRSDASIYNPLVIRSLLLLSLRKRIPVFGFSIPFVKAGALLGVGINPITQGKNVAQIVLQLLRQSSRPYLNPPLIARIPELKLDFEFAVNLIVAERLKTRIPRSIIDKAIKVYQEGSNNEATN